MLAALEARCFEGGAWSEAELGAFLARPDAVLALLEVGEAAVGYTIGWTAGGVGELIRIAVAPALRGQGHGQRLLDDWQGRAEASGCGEMWLEARASNAAALALYRRAGWAETGRRRRYYSDGEDAVLMTRLS